MNQSTEWANTELYTVQSESDTLRKSKSTVGSPHVLSSMSSGDINVSSCRGITDAIPQCTARILCSLWSSRYRKLRIASTYSCLFSQLKLSNSFYIGNQIIITYRILTELLYKRRAKYSVSKTSKFCDNCTSLTIKILYNIVAAFRGMHVLPAKQSYAWLPNKCDYQTDRQTDTHTDIWTDAGQSDPYVPLCFTGNTKMQLPVTLTTPMCLCHVV